MADWRELGEVPDSEDDDGIDSQNIDHGAVAEHSTKDSNTANHESSTRDVWDIPSSQENSVPVLPLPLARRPSATCTPPRPPQAHVVLDSSPLTSPLSSPRSLSPSSPPLSQELPSIIDLTSNRTDSGFVPIAEVPHDLGPRPSRDEKSGTDTHIRSPSVILSQNDARTTSAPGFRNSPSRTPLQSQILGHDVEYQSARQVAVHYERSLRTRRPEQMRPYFTEQARFNNSWRKHGLRPLRFAITEDAVQLPEDPGERVFEPPAEDILPQQAAEETEGRESDGGMDGEAFGSLSSSPMDTSPLNHRAGPSSQMGSQGDTDHTSIDGEDLPSLQDLIQKRYSDRRKLITKRKLPLVKPTTRKRLKVQTNLDRSTPLSEEPQKFIRPPSSSDPFAFPDENDEIGTTGTSVEQMNIWDPDWNSNTQTTERHRDLRPAEFVIESDSDEGTTEKPEGMQVDRPAIGSDAESTNDSDVEPEVMNQDVQRIRGVLPASWLRLDQQSGRNKIQQKVHGRSKLRSPQKELRRGVALPRVVERSTAHDNLLFDESEDELAEIPPAANVEPDNQLRLVVKPARGEMVTEIPSDDDSGSAMEDNHVDYMVPGRKRQSKISDAFRRAAKRPKVSSVGSRTPKLKAPHQPKTTGLFGAPKRASTIRKETARKHAGNRSNHASLKRSDRPGRKLAQPSLKPPQLSILDVIEPDAPHFLRVAARTARASRNQGRASPSRKTIQLANRQDHLEAASVLADWKKGSIKQRPSVTYSRRAPPARAQLGPLTARSANEPGPRARARTHNTPLSYGAPRKLTKHISDGGHVSYKAQRFIGQVAAPQSAAQNGRDAWGIARPAQLEEDNSRPDNAASFHSAKKLLDRVYRAKRAKSNASGSHRSTTVADSIAPSIPIQSLPRPTSGVPISDDSGRPRQTRQRKVRKPQRIDVDEPQYSHAHDPLPVVQAPVIELEPTRTQSQATKLQGLGPYGTKYTTHFEVFPLHPDIYFHNSTLIGSGQIAATLAESYELASRRERSSTKLILGEENLSWGPWNAQVSSEMGVVLDHVADYLEHGSSADWPKSPSAKAAASHLYSYVKNFMTLDAEGDAKVYVGRILELVQSFDTRIATCLQTGGLDQTLDHTFAVYDRLVLIIFLSVKLCCSDATLTSEKIQAESLLNSVSMTLVKALSRRGMQHLRHVYSDLSSISLREKGLREDTPAMHSWVLLFKILENARIPRASFWDVVQAVVTPSDLNSVNTARDLDRAWESMFTLLPLTEFNDDGKIVPGQRHRATSDGWPMVQKLLKRVFELYQVNPRQPPSFNNYCRALIGRCHYLVQEWGWRRCSSIVGVIFDFFGSQQLAHLRNEEAYGSPRFLEELSTTPSLEVKADDVCFHIFLKLLALGICKLRKAGLTKDIRNLVMRTLPNHTRQHLKEQNIHERDLAALRNHHDLLCTLFWAAPTELRPSVNHLERLVVPANSHKEACLINLRTWSQLARFVIANGEATTSFAPFNQWRNTFFQQMIHQYDTVASDIEQQFQGLSKDVSQSVSPGMVNAMVSANRAAVMDVIYTCVSSSLDVMRCASGLEAATFALNAYQLQQIFQHFYSDPTELDWAILRTSLSTLEVFLSHVDDSKEAEKSQQSESQVLDSVQVQGDDALMVLDHDLASSYFKMARRVLSRCSESSILSAEVVCTEQVVTLSARLGMRFIHAGVMKLGAMFTNGKYGLFLDLPHKLGLEQRRYLTLFVSTLLKDGFDSFDDEDFTLRELWMLAIVKPRSSLMYENQLAEQLALRGADFVPQSMIGLAICPEYGTNRDLFQFAISSMRQSVRDAGPNLHKVLKAKHQKTLKLVMDQLKEDLKTISEDSAQHSTYVYFVRDIVSLVRAHGSGICTVDKYFYQISKEYSPSMQDPQLQVAGMMSYGIRLADDDSRVLFELFFFLFNNFKFALINDKLDEEVAMLEKGIRIPSVLNFVLGKMLPSIVRAVTTQQTASPLFDVYASALSNMLDDGVAPPELREDSLGPLRSTLEAILGGLDQFHETDSLTGEMLHIARQFIGMLNVFWPSLFVLALSGSSTKEWLEVRSLLRRIRASLVAMDTTELDSASFGRLEPGRETLATGQLREVAAKATAKDMHIDSFISEILGDIREHWIVTEDRVCIQAPDKIQDTQSTQINQGIPRPKWGEMRGELLADLRGRVGEWKRWWGKTFGDASPRHDAEKSAIVLGF